MCALITALKLYYVGKNTIRSVQMKNILDTVVSALIFLFSVQAFIMLGFLLALCLK